jgi:hypothetical protein
VPPVIVSRSTAGRLLPFELSAESTERPSPLRHHWIGETTHLGNARSPLMGSQIRAPRTAVVEGMVSAGAKNLDATVGMTTPGVCLLVNRSRRILLASYSTRPNHVLPPVDPHAPRRLDRGPRTEKARKPKLGADLGRRQKVAVVVALTSTAAFGGSDLSNQAGEHKGDGGPRLAA